MSGRSVFVTASSELNSSLWELVQQVHPGEEFTPENGLHSLYLREKEADGTAHFTEVGPEDGPMAKQRAFTFAGASHDLGTIVFGLYDEGEPVFWPGDETHRNAESLYEYTGTNQAEPALVGVTNDSPLNGSLYRNEHAELISQCGTELGSGTEDPGSTYNAVSSSGALVYFTALHGECEQPAVNEVYGRVQGARTVAVSEPEMTSRRAQECTGVCREDEEGDLEEQQDNEHLKRKDATFVGASEDGAKVFFTTEQPLLNADKDSGNDLYEAELEGGVPTRLVMVSEGDAGSDPSLGAGADVVGVASISEDGSHVYFEARGVLAPANADGEAAEAGGYNLYDYDTDSGSTQLVAVLMSAAEASAIEEPLVEEVDSKQAECERISSESGPEAAEECLEELASLKREVAETVEAEVGEVTHLTRESRRPFETTPAGRFMIFESPRHLTGSEDTSTVDQLFEYDAQTDSVLRVSIGDLVGDGNTSNQAYVPRIVYPSSNRAGAATAASASLSLADAGQVFFTSRDPLVAGAVSERENVYEYTPPALAGVSGGAVSLISAGEEYAYLEVKGTPRLLGVDQSGRDVFFSSTVNLVPRDVDTQLDWYDARVDGGFEEPVQKLECGDACQDSASPAVVLPAPTGSALQPGGEATVAPPRPRPHETKAQRLAKALKACRKQRGKRRRVCEAAARKKLSAKASRKRKVVR
jgi:hypothetical protein